MEKQDCNTIAQEVVELLLPKILATLEGMQFMEDELLNVRQASELLKTSVQQVYQWVNQSKHGLSNFQFLKQGKQLRFSRKALLRWSTEERR